MRNSHQKGESSNPCVYCRGGHFSDSCDKYVTLDNRECQLVSQGRCFICLNEVCDNQMTESIGLETSPSYTNLSTSLATSEIEGDSIVSTRIM